MFQLSYFLSSLKSVTAVLLLSLFGVFATRTERMSPASRKSIAKISSHMMLPALLIARVPQSDLTLTTLSTYWVLPFACFTYVSFGYLTSLLLCKLTKVDKHERTLILACSSLPTSTGPILALYAAVLTALPSETNLDKDAALASGAAQILIYTAFMNILRWTIGWELMKKPDEIVERGEDDMVAMVDLSVNRSSKPNSTPSSTTKQFLCVALKKTAEPPVIAAILSILLALITPLHSIFYDEDAPLRPCTIGVLETFAGGYVPLALLILGSQLAYGPDTSGSLSKKAIILVYIVRLLLVPFLSIFIIKYLRRNSEWFNINISPTLQLVLLLESSGPPAINLASMAQLRGYRERETASMLFYTYMGSMGTICFWVSMFASAVFSSV